MVIQILNNILPKIQDYREKSETIVFTPSFNKPFNPIPHEFPLNARKGKKRNVTS